jgi:GT2 family glycosyltransferase
MSTIGLVIIGRNEGPRLRRCLESLAGNGLPCVYVDSGSTDDSVEIARSLGADCVELDTGQPFTAARARNAGFDRLSALSPQVQYVQFIDGDCEMLAGWLEAASSLLECRSDVAVVCGRLVERAPDASLYNRLCQLEWDGPGGEVGFSGGIAMVRASAFAAVHGFNAAMIAGEEPELCVRLRQAGMKIWRLDQPMANHDAAIQSFGQWWKRAVRAGHACAQGAAMHGRSPQRHWVHETRSNWFWGLLLPAICAGLIWPTRGFSALGLLLYVGLAFRIYRTMRRRGCGGADSRLYAGFCVLGKFPQAMGQLLFYWRRWMRRPATLIEYK